MIVKESLKVLLVWFKRHQRILPWRQNPSLYRVWVSEIMLQQTQVVTVMPYFDRFMDRFPDVKTLARASEQAVLKSWEGLGYYSRARNLRKAAQLIAEQGFPKSYDGWLALPGVGPYTAGAICSIALGLPEAILDGNVERVVSRLRCVRRSHPDFKNRWWKTSRALVRVATGLKLSMSDLNQALIEIGATVCTPKKPDCERCPFQDICQAARLPFEARVSNYPGKKPKPKWIKMKEERQVLISNGKVLLQKNQKGQWRAGLWDFAQTKRPQGAKFLGRLRTPYVVTHHRVDRVLKIWEVKAMNLAGLRWVSLTEPSVPLGAPIQKVLRTLGRLSG